jgi:hypothetical protein
MPVKIHGKEYKTVAERVADIHTIHKDKPLSIETDLVSWNDGVVIFKATVTTGAGIFTGYAYEREGASQINKTSALENCETSSIGRALAAAGYGGTEYASANEVQNAIKQQKSGANTNNTTIKKPLNKEMSTMLGVLKDHQNHPSLNKTQKDKVKTLIAKELTEEDAPLISKYHEAVMGVVKKGN